MFVNVILILMFYCQYYVMVRMSFHLSFFFHVNIHIIYIKYLCYLSLLVPLLCKHFDYGFTFIFNCYSLTCLFIEITENSKRGQVR